MATITGIFKRITQSTKEHDQFYDSKEWRKLRRHVLALNPFCVYCQHKGIAKPAAVVDHYKPRKLWPELSLKPDNLKPSCHHHHNIKRSLEARTNDKDKLLELFRGGGFYP